MDLNKIQNLKNQAISAILEAESDQELEELRIAYLGRKGEITQLLKKIPSLSSSERKEIGRTANDAKRAIEQTLKDAKKAQTTKKVDVDKEWLDVTAPGLKPNVGHLHPLSQILYETVDVFKQIGYQVAEGPEIEDDRHNFEILNFLKDHPARDTQMTLYLETKGTKVLPGEILLRTHTSAMQGRVMEKTKPPMRVIVPGKCYRYEQVDASHGFEFWQVEGFAVDKKITLTDLFGTIEYVLKKLMGEKAKIKFACTYFPFVEPGVDTYLECTLCQGKGCPFCKGLGWSEVLPAGMIHPNVLKACQIDPQKYTGFAFAIGLSRIVSLRYNIHDLRLLFTPDLRILNQF
ncbi:phenylalanine--tRNA ligase subunit alpha [Microgenomates group bacterium RBG_19FT_COMBO_39_10]|nr:MAG: phenylalanine--tRNA ligase subunit alpha [Microgenomates group bacterium RBG_19FT_COMBO_39_10]